MTRPAVDQALALEAGPVVPVEAEVEHRLDGRGPPTRPGTVPVTPEPAGAPRPPQAVPTAKGSYSAASPSAGGTGSPGTCQAPTSKGTASWTAAAP